MYFVSSRGCPHKCIFCSNPVWRSSVQKFRLREPKHIAEEIGLLYNRYGVKEFYDYKKVWASENQKIRESLLARVHDE